MHRRHGVRGIGAWQRGWMFTRGWGNCDLVARMLRVMNVLLMQFVITRAIRGCLRTQSLLVKRRHIGPAMMYERAKQKAFVIS